MLAPVWGALRYVGGPHVAKGDGLPEHSGRSLDLNRHLRCMLLGAQLARVDAFVRLRLVASGLCLCLPYRPRPDVADSDADGFALKASFENVGARVGGGHAQSQAWRLRVPHDALLLAGLALKCGHPFGREIDFRHLLPPPCWRHVGTV